MDTQDTRRSAEHFLALIKASHRGKFKVYIGMSAGVGKTYRMLQEAHQLLDAGVDVQIGYIETHGRPETEALTEGLPFIPRRKLFYKGKELEEMDMQAIINLHPDIVVVDELAHTNIEGSANPKRWQDVMQILDAGISVISAVNIQHIEGVNEQVQEITGIEVHERVPDSVLATADEVVNIDLTADELIERLKAGKIYKPDKVPTALSNFFRQENILELRELALKEVALRVEKKVENEVTEKPALLHDKLLAVIDSSEKRARRLIRKTARLATHLNSSFIVLYVQSDRETADRIPLANQRYLINNLNLATELGGQIRQVHSNRPVETIVEICREQKINIVCVGRPEFSLFSLLKNVVGMRRLIGRLSRMNIDLVSYRHNHENTTKAHIGHRHSFRHDRAARHPVGQLRAAAFARHGNHSGRQLQLVAIRRRHAAFAQRHRRRFRFAARPAAESRPPTTKYHRDQRTGDDIGARPPYRGAERPRLPRPNCKRCARTCCASWNSTWRPSVPKFGRRGTRRLRDVVADRRGGALRRQCRRHSGYGFRGWCCVPSTN